MEGIKRIITEEPALIMGVVSSVLVLLVGLGVIGDVEKANIEAAISSVLILVGSLVVRQSVTPTSKLPDGAVGEHEPTT